MTSEGIIFMTTFTEQAPYLMEQQHLLNGGQWMTQGPLCGLGPGVLEDTHVYLRK